MKQKLVTKGKAGVSVSPSLDNVRFRLMVFLASVLSLLFITQAGLWRMNSPAHTVSRSLSHPHRLITISLTDLTSW